MKIEAFFYFFNGQIQAFFSIAVLGKYIILKAKGMYVKHGSHSMAMYPNPRTGHSVFRVRIYVTTKQV